MTIPVRWGILSSARIGRTFIRGVGLTSSSCVQAVASREWTRAFEFAKENGIPRAFGSYEELLHSGEVDVIYNPLPNSLHAEWTIKALEAGLPVLCEKPFAANAAEARAVAEASARTGKLVAEAFMYRYHPLYEQLFQLIKAGAIGTIKTIRCMFNFSLGDSDGIISSAELAGGALMDVGCYCVSFCRLITGSEPLRITAFEHREGVDKTLIGLLEFPDNVLAHIECSIETQEERRAEITGTNGTISITDPWYPGEDSGHFSIRSGENEERKKTPGANLYQLEAEDFVRAYKIHQPVRWPIDDAVANMTAIDALYASAKEGRAVPLNS